MKIKFKTALLAQEVGFNVKEKGMEIYDFNGESLDVVAQLDMMNAEDSLQDYFKKIKTYPLAPTQSELQTWLRNLGYDVFIEPRYCDPKLPAYGFLIKNRVIPSEWVRTTKEYGTWEDALEDGLYQALLLKK